MFQLNQRASNARALMAAALACALLAAGEAQAQKRLDFEAGTIHWEDAANWNPDGIPGTAEIAEIIRSAAGDTLDISSAQTITEMIVGFRSNSGTYTSGVSTLRELPGTNLVILADNGSRIGRDLASGDAIGSSTAQVIQTGGSVTIPNGTNGLRLSQNGTNIANSLYEISGGSVSGGPTSPMTAPLQIGNGTSNFGVAEFHVIGSAATSIRFEDIRIFGSTSSSGIARMHFTLDNLGVTPMTAEDEMRFAGTGTNQLVVDLAGLPPLVDIPLVIADRLNTGSSAPAETFTGLPDNSPITASFAGTTYHWLLDYTDASDNGVLDASIVLRFQSIDVVPEVSSFAMLGLLSAGATGLCRLRRRRTG